MELNTKEWKNFEIKRIFKKPKIKKFSSLPESEGSVSFISSTSFNNGCAMKCDEKLTVDKCITVSTNGACFDCFYHEEPIAPSTDVEVLVSKWLNKENALFICSILQQEQYKYSYGRKPKNNKVWNTIIPLPIKTMNTLPIIDEEKEYSDEGFIPDWQFMEEYIKSLHHKPITTKRANEPSIDLNVDKWEDFLLSNLFNIKKGKRLTSADQEEGSNNYVGAIDSNNGIANHIGQKPIHKGNTITLSYNGSVGEAFYQKDDYWATDDVNALYPKFNNFNCKIGLFFATVIRQEKYKYTYGRKWTLEKMNSTIIKLPIQINEQGHPILDDEKKYHQEGFIPDWKFMEDYINSLPYSDRI